MAFTGSITSGNNDEQNGIGGPASAFGKSSSKLPKMGKVLTFKGDRPQKFTGTGAGKLNKTGATTKSESLSRLRSKGALA